ncbi:glycoside hydrolase family 2 [Xanthomonas sp. AmX2]|uniref:glycosyl hydrolase 2 galactose-binding domain-containing protein n=1 Tax=Xanthomonas sp. TaxID=29446 RepID=UPI00197D5502|nr:LamG-like jellyroll fold domain-containing protein [Xanthomonas sp.]MBN6151931.1 glycoside hydrolase family 2 [Xanthomonas sp.]
MLKCGRSVRSWACGFVLCLSWLSPVCASAQPAAEASSGPYDVRVLAGGVGLDKPLPAATPWLRADAEWTMRAWVRPSLAPSGRSLIAGVGDPASNGRFLAIDAGTLAFWQDGQATLRSDARLPAGRWHALAAVAQGGRVALYVDGRRVADGALRSAAVAPRLAFGPHIQPWTQATHFAGDIAGFSVAAGAQDAAALAAASAAPPDDALARFEDAAPTWPVQTKQMAGQRAPQPAATLPRSAAPYSAPVARAPADVAALQPLQSQTWRINAWQLAAAPELGQADGAALSRADYAGGAAWRAATVPGTVLTTLVDRGVYPDPDFGLNNLAIPESLNQHDWWYRSAFEVPAALAGQRLQLLFNGINYAGEIWVNGARVGQTRGAFARGGFDVSAHLQPGRRNVVAVRVSPPPHPGLPHEQSMSAGVGENGGMQALDGPTFIASEGWDWIPAVRDRNTGLWQDVQLRATGAVAIGDTQVITARLAPDHRRAELLLRIPLRNDGDAPVQGELSAAFGDVRIARPVSVPPGGTTVEWNAAEVPQLAIAQPRLWWPNGYGEPALYTLEVGFDSGGQRSDAQRIRFGIREVSYELSLFDEQGQLQRVLVDLNQARARGERIVDVRHGAIRPVPGGNAASLYPGALRSPAVRKLDDARLAPHLAIRINGVRIAVKGGNWGMDDWRKRVSRERLEPYFRLQREAHFNVVRNWVGQNTEAAFYELADEYGMLVFSDFWASTQNYNLEPQDEALFLANAAEVIRRFRNHPSIVLWFGRNEGVPQPLLNEGLDALVAELDGTRWYTGSSNEINLQRSGPYNYREPVAYFTELAQGFSVEVGTPSFSTLESFKASVAEPDWWPIGDAWAYHDWHQSGNGDTASFMRAMRAKLGAPTGLEDFERKAQLLNYETHRAIFEGFNAQLWSKNSGRLLWMSHPAWPSNVWQIYSHDYDTHAAYYGVRAASEPVHVQMNLPDRQLAVVNNTAQALQGLRVVALVHARDGRALGECETVLSAPALATTPVALSLAPLLQRQDGLGFVSLQLHDRGGQLLSRNFYWVAKDDAAMQGLNALPPAPLQLQSQLLADGGEPRLRVALRNPTAQVALSAKLTVVDAHGQRLLPAYYSDNYVSLLPGESRQVEIRGPSAEQLRNARVQLRGWNVPAAQVPAQP